MKGALTRRLGPSLLLPGIIGVVAGMAGFWPGWIVAAFCALVGIGKGKELNRQYDEVKDKLVARSAGPHHYWQVPETGVYVIYNPWEPLQQKLKAGHMVRLADGDPPPVRIR